jgi:hypothetical protein
MELPVNHCPRLNQTGPKRFRTVACQRHETADHISATMKWALYLLPLPMLMMGNFSPATDTGDYAPYFAFNNGVPDEGMKCSPEEWSLIQNSLESTIPGHRKLGTRARNLKDCSNQFGYYFENGCGKNGMLRSVGHTPTSAVPTNAYRAILWPQRRKTALVDRCATDDNKVNATLSALVPRLSASCRALIRAPIEISCVQRVGCDSIAHFSLWNADTDQLIVAKVPTRNGAFCASTAVAWEAISNFDVGSVQFRWQGPSDSESTRTVEQAPYLAFGRNGTNVYGMKFPIGEYTLTATVDNEPTTANTIGFQVVEC